MSNSIINTEISRAAYVKKVISIFLPVTLQNLLACGMGIVDTTMLGRLGVKELAASGAASMIYIIMANLMYGFMSGAGAYISQYWGIRDMDNIKKTMGIVYTTGIAVSLFFTGVGFAFARQIIWIIDKDLQVVELGVQYVHVIAPSYILGILSYAIVFNSRCVQKMKACTLIDLFAILCNSLLNYMFIWGKFGAPAWGIRGAAFATVLSRFIEFSLLALYVYLDKDFPLRAKLSELRDSSMEFRKKIMATAIPVALTDCLWGITLTVYLAAYGLIGTAAVAAVQVINIVSECFQAIFYGVGSATAVMIGEQLGQGRVKRAERSAKQFMTLAAVLSCLMSLAMYLINPLIAAVYEFDEATTAVLMAGLNVTALTIFFRMTPYIIMCGILRAGGDTKATMYIDLGYNWLLTIPAMFIAILLFKADLSITMLVCYTGEFIKGIHCFLRYRTGKWKNVLTDAEPVD